MTVDGLSRTMSRTSALIRDARIAYFKHLHHARIGRSLKKLLISVSMTSLMSQDICVTAAWIII